jgi:hypothetical protein
MPKECAKFFDVFDPSSCCDFPYPLVPQTLANTCDKACQAKEDSSQCCFAECVEEKSNFKDGGKIKSENVFLFFESHFRYGNFSK